MFLSGYLGQKRLYMFLEGRLLQTFTAGSDGSYPCHAQQALVMTDASKERNDTAWYTPQPLSADWDVVQCQ
jgi:hypothetical protein